MKVNKKRWDVAQSSEKGYWMQWNTRSLKDYLENVYRKKLSNLEKKWSKFIQIKKDTKILQIGCGPLDIINYFKNGKRYSIDPLADFYKERYKIDYNSSNLQKACGESIPFPNNYFELIIINNVLDHTFNPKRVLKEIKRALKREGILHLEMQVYQKKFLVLAKVWTIINKVFMNKIFNIHHPHMYTQEEMINLVLDDFNIIHQECEDIQKLKEEIKKQKLSRRILLHFGILGNINYTLICKKKNL